jgi:hypothetical protein
MVHQYISALMDDGFSRATDVDPFLTFVFPGVTMDDACFQSTSK